MRISRAIAVLATMVAGSAPVAADWNVTEYRDDRTNARVNVGTLPAASGDAWLRLRCVNDRMFPAVILAKAVTAPDIVRLRVTYKFDTSAAVTRMSMMAEKGRELWPWVDEPLSTVQRISRGRRLLIELLPGPDEKVSLEFNLTGSDRVVPRVQCPPPQL